MCVLAYVEPGGFEQVVEATCDGTLAREPRGSGGFGYDPLFLLPAYGQTMAELPPAIKNQISHRAQALAQVRPLRKNVLTVVRSKTGKPRLVPVPAVAQKFLKALPLPLTYWQLNDEFVAARDAARLSHVRFHDLRHTAASWLINAGVDLYTVGRILGHSTPLTTQRYAHLSHASLKRAMAKLR